MTDNIAAEINAAVDHLLWHLAFEVDPDHPEKLEDAARQGCYREKLRSLVWEAVLSADTSALGEA